MKHKMRTFQISLVFVVSFCSPFSFLPPSLSPFNPPSCYSLFPFYVIFGGYWFQDGSLKVLHYIWFNYEKVPYFLRDGASVLGDTIVCLSRVI